MTQSLAEMLSAVDVIDLTQPLSEDTQVLQLPEPFANTPGLKRHEISRFDDRGPAWAWYWLEIGEHVGTHFDAPIHWVTGKDGDDLASVPVHRLIAPAVMIDKSAEAAEDADYLLTVDDVRAFEAEHRALPEGGWVLLRTGWDARAAGCEGISARSIADLEPLRAWLERRDGPLVLDAKVDPDICAAWLEEAFRAH